MSDIFREVDEALQREKAEKFWNEYGTTLLTAAVLMVVGTGIGVTWRTWDHGRNQQETARLVSAIDANDTAQLQNVIDDSRKGPEAIALFAAADKLRMDGDIAGAAERYKQAAENRAIPKDFRDLARILYVRAADAAPADKRAVIKPVLSKEKSPFIWHARIEAALIEAADGNFQAAADHLAPFAEAESSLPVSLVERGNSLRGLYEVRARNSAPAEQEEGNKQ